MTDHIENRKTILHSLRCELVGPDPRGGELDCSKQIVFPTVEASLGPWRQAGSGGEILQRDPPAKRYGIGILYPAETLDQDESGIAAEVSLGEAPREASEELPDAEVVTADARADLDAIAQRQGGGITEKDSDDLDLSSANSYRPSSVAISFLAKVPPDSALVVQVTGGRYEARTVTIAGKERTWWLRSPVSLRAQFGAQKLLSDAKKLQEPDATDPENLDGLVINVTAFSRPTASPEERLVTVSLVNRSPATSIDQKSLFQVHFSAAVKCPRTDANILHYPAVQLEDPDAEEQSLSLLYRETETFAVGHGCAADWTLSENAGAAIAVSAECLPIFEAPSVTPNVTSQDGKAIEVSMAALAGLLQDDDGFRSLGRVVGAYDEWISLNERQLPILPPTHQPAARRHLDECSRSASRMRDGIEFLTSDPIALRAFRLANEAILLQQLHSSREPRQISFDTKSNRRTFSEPYIPPDPLHPAPGRGKWRAFQIAFLLMTLRSTADGHAPDRETVELIWFPTGGGKTEAYLALAAFSMILRRLKDSSDTGVEVIMRYTLRLLTAQQFQRAAGLLCALEYLRRKPGNAGDLGPIPFSIGIWLGGTSTPNTRADARTALSELGRHIYADNPFLITKCPWCSAEMGQLKTPGRKKVPPITVHGYERQGDSVALKCPDHTCDFSAGLPIFVIDEDIYEHRPTLVVGTVDKFAMLAWRPGARALFGIGPDGHRDASPPGLIIQDELHLISGPLGSMVGHFEPIIEELCTDRRNGAVPPKIVSSTATIRRYASQILALYGRNDVALFPPPGLSAGDSFFAKYARKSDGTLEPGRTYVGVHAPGLGSIQTTQVRTFAALMQAPLAMPDPDRDPWWTLLAFFNSLRELGTTLSLFQSDIPDYLKVVRNRTGAGPNQIRRLRNVKELTGRLPSDQIPQAISSLEATYGGQRTPVDVCLASNIIEVGVDIDRLSLMTVVGQPKTTSQYIQVTGRVGRRWWERPGVVVTLYGAAKPRDRSHFEKFRSYHERLYAQVEPTSVTPYSRPALERALHAVIVAYVRQLGSEAAAGSPYPVPQQLIDAARELLQKRVASVDPSEIAAFNRQFDERVAEWHRWERIRYTARPTEEDLPLIRPAGAYTSPEHMRLSWATPQSMRSVDAECQVEITTLYLTAEGDIDA